MNFSDNDVVVIGSGAAGLAAAVGAASEGAKVVLLERTDRVGGTSAVSGGVVWAPFNSHMSAVSIEDSYEEAVEYLCSHPGLKDEALLRAYVSSAADVVAYLENKTSARFHAASITDYRPDLPGAKEGGRAIAPDPFEASVLGDRLKLVRQREFSELERLDAVPNKDDLADVDDNLVVDGSPTLDWAWSEAQRRGLWARGLALVGGLFEGCIRHDVQIVTNARARRLLTEDGTVVGVLAQQTGEAAQTTFRARGGVVLACGGFESSPELMARFLEAPHAVKGSPPWNEGDGLVMAMSIGASLGNLDSAWWNIFAQIPGEFEDGRQMSRIVSSSGRGKPGTIMVNAFGRRFVNEAQPYHGVALTMNQRDPIDGGYPNLPAWLVFDHVFRDVHGIPAILDPRTVDPSWVAKADSPSELAEMIGIDPKGLVTTIDRFNQYAWDGRDAEFGRGESVYDQQYGDTTLSGPARCLGVLDTAPWYALRVHPGVLGTNGGVRIDACARVLDAWDEPIKGLYGAGNVTAAFMGRTDIGAGATLGPAVVFGCLAGQGAARTALSKSGI